MSRFTTAGFLETGSSVSSIVPKLVTPVVLDWEIVGPAFDSNPASSTNVIRYCQVEPVARGKTDPPASAREVSGAPWSSETNRSQYTVGVSEALLVMISKRMLARASSSGIPNVSPKSPEGKVEKSKTNVFQPSNSRPIWKSYL